MNKIKIVSNFQIRKFVYKKIKNYKVLIEKLIQLIFDIKNNTSKLVFNNLHN